jgi:hypothetical protein
MNRATLLIVLSCVGCGTGPGFDGESVGSSEQALSNKDFDADFSGCSEFAGIGLVPAAGATPLVPAGYTPVLVGSQALVVVRVAKCASAVIDGKSVGETITSQVGVTLQGPDGSADINNYTVLYATNQARLHARYQAAGLRADKSNALSLSLSAGALLAASASPHSSSFSVSGAAAVPTAAPGQFIASWWGEGNHGTVQSRTVFPSIAFNTGAVTTLTTSSDTELASLIGGTSLTFPVLDSYNTFSSSHLEVRVTD